VCLFVKQKHFSTNKICVGGLAIAVPGALKGYSAIYKLYGGGVPWDSLFEPAIKLCEDGIDISERLEINMKNNQDMIKNDSSLRYSFCFVLFFIFNRKYIPNTINNKT